MYIYICTVNIGSIYMVLRYMVVYIYIYVLYILYVLYICTVYSIMY